MAKSVLFFDKWVPIIPATDLPPISFPINYITDSLFGSFLPQELLGRELRWHTMRRHPRWKKNTIPVAVLSGARGSSKRNKILKMCREASHPIILLYPDGGQSGYKICDEEIYNHLILSENVIIFTWGVRMTEVQKIVFQYLLRHWHAVTKLTYTYLQNLDYIPNYIGLDS